MFQTYDSGSFDLLCPIVILSHVPPRLWMELAWFTERQVDAKNGKRIKKWCSVNIWLIIRRQCPFSSPYLREMSMQEGGHLVAHTQEDCLSQLGDCYCHDNRTRTLKSRDIARNRIMHYAKSTHVCRWTRWSAGLPLKTVRPAML